MVKKIIGGLFLGGALLILIGAIANGTLFSDQGSDAATYGTFIGTLIPIVIYLWSGIFWLTFDQPTKLNYIDGFKKRSKQSSQFILFIVAYLLLIQLSAIGVALSDTDNFLLSYILSILPYIVPLIVFITYYQVYVLTHRASKKYYVNSESALNEYLSVNETFYAWSDDSFVLASDKALYFPQLFCLIPFHAISSVKLYKQLGEQGIYIHLTNGKKIYIATKHCECIQEAIRANKPIDDSL